MAPSVRKKAAASRCDFHAFALFGLIVVQMSSRFLESSGGCVAFKRQRAELQAWKKTGLHSLSMKMFLV